MAKVTQTLEKLSNDTSQAFTRLSEAWILSKKRRLPYRQTQTQRSVRPKRQRTGLASGTPRIGSEDLSKGARCLPGATVRHLQECRNLSFRKTVRSLLR
jgi:hypothetical protein